MAEVCGAEELLASLRQQMATLPRITLEVGLQLPASAKPDATLCTRVVEDIATWMGVPDECFAVHAWSTSRPDDDPKGKQSLSVVAHLGKGSSSHHSECEPRELALMTTDYH